MPKIRKHDLKGIKYVSMADYKYKLDEIYDYQAKMDFTNKYLLAYSQNKGEKDYSFEEAVHIARMKMGEASLKLKSKLPESSKQRIKDNPNIVNPNLMVQKNDLANQMFFGNPALYFTGIDADNLLEDHVWGDFNKKIKDIEKNPNSLDVRYRMEANIGSKKEFEDAYKATKPGFFSKMFNTSSTAYKKLDTMWNAFNNPNHAMYGDMVGLENASNEYLQHKFPNWRPGMQIPPEAYAKLDKTEAARVRFCENINSAIKEQKENTQGLKEMTNACENQNIKIKDIDGPNFIQNIFQNQLQEDLIEDDSVDYENENEISSEKVKENENEIEEEKEEAMEQNQ